MNQVVLEQPGRFVAHEVVPPVRGRGEALVRVHRVGVCGTDFHAFHGRQPYLTFPRVLGHELAVTVVEAPPNDLGITAGDDCAVEPYLNCHHCDPCHAGRYNCCENLKVLGVHVDGGMRQLLAVPLDHLHKSSRLTFDQLALVEPMSIGAHAVARSGLSEGTSVLVVGAGPIGLGATQFARAAGAHVRVLEISLSRRESIAKLGVETLAEADDRLADVVIDATGNAGSMAASLSRVAFGGRIVWVGLVQGAVSVDDPLLNRREITLMASRNSAGDFPRIIRMIEDGRIDTSPWVTHRLRLEEVPALFDEVTRQREGVKTMIEVD